MFKNLVFPGTAIDLAYPFQFTFGTFNVAQPYSVQLPRQLAKEQAPWRTWCFSPGQVHNLDPQGSPAPDSRRSSSQEWEFHKSHSSTNSRLVAGPQVTLVRDVRCSTGPLSSWPRLQKCQEGASCGRGCLVIQPFSKPKCSLSRLPESPGWSFAHLADFLAVSH